MSPVQIFISYRRDDSAGYARAIYDDLACHFGDARVFIDVDDIVAGQPFDEAIDQAVGSAQVLLVLIGKRWPGDSDGQTPRLFDPQDFVHREVAGALQKGMHVLPLLLDGTPMPGAAQLPAPLQPLATRHALEISNQRYASDLRRLVAVLQGMLGPAMGPALGAPDRLPGLPESLPAKPQAPAAQRRSLLGWAVGAALVLVLAGAGWWFQSAGQRNSAGQGALPASAVSSSSAVAAQRPDINGRWSAQVVYDWPNANYLEIFEFSGQAQQLQGSASFLKVPRGLLEGRIDAQGLEFATQTTEHVRDTAYMRTHRYRGQLLDGQLRLVMQTEGGASSHVPVEFTAQRVAAP